MSFKGLFIGIDHYRSPLISNLSCSVRDAQALYGLFCDTFGSMSFTLLKDHEATRNAILTALHELQRSKPDDVVVIAFSGYGSDTHHLITHDADPLTFDNSAIDLDDLTGLFSKIPAQNLILLLDCCFAGGAGAKVFHAPVAPKISASAEALLTKISGKGRLIFTAATADQEAIEDRRRGHGLFTFFVIEALKGAPQIVRASQIPLLSLVDFVARSVVDAAKQIRHTQELTLRGSIERDLAFSILTAGVIYKRFFPEQVTVTVGGDIKDLAPFGFPQPLLDIWGGAIPSLNQLQQDAINKHGLLQGKHLVVSAPTSSGKTMIGELAALCGYTKGERAYMLLPLRALVNDKYDEFNTKYRDFGIRVIRSTGEISDDNDTLFRGKFNIALLCGPARSLPAPR